jgi:hypothetical protein
LTPVDYDQYYASLAASAAPSTQHTPSGEFSVLGDFEEDRKPNIEYLDSLNEHNKRSRSVEDQGGDDAERKLAKVVPVAAAGDGWSAAAAASQAGNGEHEHAVSGVEDGSGMGMGMDADDVAGVEDDPIVYGPSPFFFFLPCPLYTCISDRTFQPQWMASQCPSLKLKKNTTT